MDTPSFRQLVWRMNIHDDDDDEIGRCVCNGRTVTVCVSFSSAIDFMYNVFGVDKNTSIHSHTQYTSPTYGVVSMTVVGVNDITSCPTCCMY